MTFRAAAAAARIADGVIAVGGDVPPELSAEAAGRVRHALLGHGARDEWYTQALFERDVQRLRDANVAVTAVEFDGGHEWSDEIVRAASLFLRERMP